MKPQYIFKQLIGTLVFMALLFIAAGKWLYFPGIYYLCIGVTMFVLGQTVLRPEADLQAERSKPAQGGESWDKILLLFSLPVTLTMYIIAGLDSGRYGWSPGFHWSATAAGALLTIAGQLLFLVAQKQNRYFSSTVRIQTDRDHQVCDTGVYRFVRHPGYLGTIIQTIGFPLLLGSLWSFVPAAILALIFFFRTYREDKVLFQELPGYREYTHRIPFRLLPYIW
ncbi:MAG TPA: isoprenylcysteine carboxylmethyltransferase family protein [Bacteroidales bacterium]|nr:isoprenylcysteine carboxylmethyltransferase family protein [Bacteroidales bacterium]HRZ50105.1 isoprenylcysteine carboxylmethyltransferase family protein [Bacteroidales bacterium]